MIKTPLSTVIGGAFWTPSATILGSASRTLNQIIKSLFANNEQGFAYDPNDLSTMFQDATGTVPVTAAGQPVGLMLDKSKGLVLGTNVISNSNFASLNGWTYGSFMQAVLVQGGVQISSPTSTTGGDIGSSTTNHFSWSPIVSLGKRFKITFDAKHVSGTGVLQVGSSFSVGLQINPNDNGGVFKRYTTEVTGSLGGFATAVTFGATNGSVWVINNVVSQEVIGNHSYQTTSASRPILRQNAITGAYYLEFDGSDDFLQTSNIDFTATDKVSLFAGVRKLSDMNTAVVAELSTTSDNGKAFTLFAPALLGRAKFLFRSVGSIADLSGGAFAEDTKYSAPFTAVAVGRAKISMDYMSLKLNGALVGDAITDQGTGNYGNYPLYIGRRAGSSNPFNGHIYSLIGIGRLTTDAETKALEKLIAKNTGVTLSV